MSTKSLKHIVITKDGPVQGCFEKSDQRNYFRFKKIPYAKPPVGYLRFMPPSPMQPWTKELDCTQDAPLPLSASLDDEIVGSEDCLYIDISTPKIDTKKLLPVMFWIGSFCFFINIDSILNPKLIIEQDIVFVKCGFRLGPFGFLSINDIIAPGNNGLKDIVMALKWVQLNISAFGGDPNNVTLFGMSSGGAMVHYMTLSPMASGLFHKAIIQSASAINNWSFEKNPTQQVIKLAKELGITNTNIVDMVKDLKNLPAIDIIQACIKMVNKLKSDEFDSIDTIFKPCVETEFEGLPNFLPKSPNLILKSWNINKVPLIIGSCCTEASIIQLFKHTFYEDFQKKNENVSLFVPRSLGCEKLCAKIGQELLKFYLDGEKTLREDTKQQYIQLMSDYYFIYFVNKTVKIHKEIAPEYPIYYYISNYAGEWNVPETLNFFNNLGHAVETAFMFQIQLPDGRICNGSRDSIKIRSIIIKMWTNFAKYGNPTPDENDTLLNIKWDPVTSTKELNFLSIGPNLTKGINPFQERMAFWEQIFKENKFTQVVAHFNDMGILC